MGKLLAVIGAQFGDEGKGKIVDILAKEFDAIVRFNGGNNAGHTISKNGIVHPLSLVPSGVLRKKQLYISQGVVVDPKVLLHEIDRYKPKIVIDFRSHVVMPYHKLLDAATEHYKGGKRTGSLKLGIGYCYEDKNNRSGVRMEDLISPKRLKEKVENVFELHKRRIRDVFKRTWTVKLQELLMEYNQYGKRLKRYVGDVSQEITQKLKTQNILFEGAHGTFLDGVFGTYPYTVAIHTVSGSIFPYVGIPPTPLDVLGVVKAYTTRVGNGPLPTELKNATGSYLRDKGGEFGTVSKRPRRCGWLDLDLVREAHRLNGFTSIALTKVDALSGLKTIKILSNKRVVTFPGWEGDITNVRRRENLPRNCNRYISYIEKELKIRVQYVSVGPERNQIIVQ